MPESNCFKTKQTNKKALFAPLLVLSIIFSLLACQSSLEENFANDRLILQDVVRDINERYDDYNSYFSIKLADSSFILAKRMIDDSSLQPLTSTGKYLLKNEELEIHVLDTNNVFFNSIDDGWLSSEHEILFYTVRDADYVDSTLDRKYSSVRDLKKIGANWFFAKTTRSID